MCYVFYDNAAQSPVIHMKQPTSTTTLQQVRVIQLICLHVVLIWLLLHPTSDLVVLARVPVAASHQRFGNIDVDTNIEDYKILDLFHVAATMKEDTALPSMTSPNLQAMQETEATTFIKSERRKTQVNAACSANPVCAAMGLVNDCCPTAEGTYLLCCPETLPPMTAPTNPPISSPTNVPNPPPFFETDEPSALPLRSPTTSPVLRLTLVPTAIPAANLPVAIPTSLPISSAPITTPPVTLPPASLPPATLPPATLSPAILPLATSPPITPAPLFNGSPTEPPQTLSLPTTPPTTLSPTPSVFNSSTTSAPSTTSTPTMMTTVVVSSSETPSHSPSSFFQYAISAFSIVDVQLTLRSESSATRRRKVQVIESNCSQVLQNLLVKSMEAEVDSIIAVYELLYIEIQNFTSPFSNSTIRTYKYDVLMNIRSPMEEHDPNRYVEGSLLSQVQKNLFAEELRSTECPEFQYVAGVEIAVPRTMENKSPDAKKSTIPVGLVSGIVAGCAVLMIIVGAMFIGTRLRKQNRLLDDDSSPTPSIAKRPTRVSDEYNMSIVDNYEVSTLGDPVISERGNGLRNDIEDSTIGSANIEYDYKKAYSDVQSMTDSQLVESSDESSPHRRSHRFGSLDDPSLHNGGAGGSNSDVVTAAGETTLGSPFYVSEEQFDVVAPTGLLGLILETNIEDGRPMVYSIKPSSSLAHILKVGDRLIAVDGIDVSRIRASDVSRMIAEKKDHTRQLVFSRLVRGNVIPNKRY